MAGEKRYTRIPPESTGDRIYQVHTAEIEFSGLQNNHEWQVGQMYMIDGFGGNGMVHVHGVFSRGDGTGIIAVHYNKTAKFENFEPTIGNSIRYDGNVVATVSDFYDVYIPTANIMGYDNPEYGLDVDITGSANIRFAEGLPQLDAWGKLRVNGARHVGEYVFSQEDIITNNFSPSELNGGYITYNDVRNSVSVGVPGPSDPGYSLTKNGFAAFTSNTYHHYIPGSSHLFMGTARLNDPTATGVIRDWGMFDAFNGFMFRVDETGDFQVVIRSSGSGSAVETVIPRADWNGDKLNGSGDSQAILDLTKDNIYWIDIQWHGAGRVRFGTYIDGQRVVAHSYYHGNNYSNAMTQTASLPTCMNVREVAKGAGSNLFIESWSSSVWTESDIDLNQYGSSSTFASSHVTVTADGPDPWQYLFSIAPRAVLPNGETNRTLYQPTSVSAYAFDTAVTNGIDAVIDLKMEVDCVHAGHSFTDIRGTTAQVSTAGTSYEFGKPFLNEMFRGRYQSDTTDTFNNWQYGAVKNFADDGGTVVNNIASITTGNAGSPPVVTVAAGERLEVRDTSSQGPVTFPPNTVEYNGRYEFYDMPSVPELNGEYVYVKPIAYNQFEIYTDAALTTGATVTSTHSANEGYIKGFHGGRFIWSIFAKTRTALHPTGPVKLMVTINWKEIEQ